MKANKYLKDISTVDFAYSDINCRLKANLRTEKEIFLIQWRILFQKLIAWKASIGNFQWLPFVFVYRLLNTPKYIVCFYNCWKPLLEVFYIGGVLKGFARFGGKEVSF